MAPSGRHTALILHGDGEVLDTLTRWFSGFDVLTALSAFRAKALLESDRPIDVVVAPWQPGGEEIYRWVLQNRRELRAKFVFVADDVPPDFDAIVRGRCLAVPPSTPQELVRVATAVARRRAPIATPPGGIPIIGRPTLLLVDDDPMMLEAMAALLGDAGYTVSQVDSGWNAKTLLDQRDFDTIVAGWHMHDGGGGELYEWIVEHKPLLAARVVFLAEGDTREAEALAPGRPVFRKGQDSRDLVHVLGEIVQRQRS